MLLLIIYRFLSLTKNQLWVILAVLLRLQIQLLLVVSICCRRHHQQTSLPQNELVLNPLPRRDRKMCRTFWRAVDRKVFNSEGTVLRFLEWLWRSLLNCERSARLWSTSLQLLFSFLFAYARSHTEPSLLPKRSKRAFSKKRVRGFLPVSDSLFDANLRLQKMLQWWRMSRRKSDCCELAKAFCSRQAKTSRDRLTQSDKVKQRTHLAYDVSHHLTLFYFVVLKMDVKPAGSEKRKSEGLLDKKKTAIRYEKTKDSSASSSAAAATAKAATKPPPAPAPAAAPAMSESDFWKSKLKGNGKVQYVYTYPETLSHLSQILSILVLMSTVVSPMVVWMLRLSPRLHALHLRQHPLPRLPDPWLPHGHVAAPLRHHQHRKLPHPPNPRVNKFYWEKVYKWAYFHCRGHSDHCASDCGDFAADDDQRERLPRRRSVGTQLIILFFASYPVRSVVSLLLLIRRTRAGRRMTVLLSRVWRTRPSHRYDTSSSIILPSFNQRTGKRKKEGIGETRKGNQWFPRRHRVVAVFSSGHAWQFKNWKYTNPTDLFANVST